MKRNTVEARAVTVRANIARRGVRDTTVIVMESGEMFVKIYSPKENMCFVSAERAGLSNDARQKAWGLSGFKRSET